MKKTGKFKTFILITAIVTVIAITTASANNKVKENEKKKAESDNLLLSDANAVYYYGSSSSSSSVTELLTSETDLTGAAPSNIKFGINTVNGKIFYVNNLGQWVVHSASLVANTPVSATFTAAVLNNSETDEQLVTMTGILLANDNLLSIKTDLSAYSQVDIRMMVVADNTVRVTVINNTGNTITLPTITISALKLN